MHVLIPVPEDLRLRLARAILCVARGDRELTPAERSEFERRVHELGGDGLVAQEAMSDPLSFPVEPLLDAKARPFGLRIVHDALLVARADGLTERERKVAARAAVQLRLSPGTLPALRALLEVEEALRRAEAEPAPEAGSRADAALRVLRQAASEARGALLAP